MSGAIEVSKYRPGFEADIAAYRSQPRDNSGSKAKEDPAV